MQLRFTLLSIALAGAVVPAVAQDAIAPSRPVIAPVPYEGEGFFPDGLFPYRLRWDGANGEAQAVASAAFPRQAVEAATLDLDLDGTGEILVRLSEQCTPDTMEEELPQCAHVLLRWNGADWTQAFARFASRVHEVRDAQGRPGISFDGTAFGISSGRVELMSPSLVSWGNPSSAESLQEVRELLGAPASTPVADIYVGRIRAEGYEPATLLVRAVQPVFHWRLVDGENQAVSSGTSEAMPDVVPAEGGVELVTVRNGQFAAARVTLPTDVTAVFSLVDGLSDL